MSDLNTSYPADWEAKPVDQVVEFLDGKRIPLKQEDRDLMEGNIPYYGASGIIDYVNDYIFDDELILLGEDGENVVSRNLPLAFKIKGKSWVNNHAHVLRVIGANKKFIEAFINDNSGSEGSHSYGIKIHLSRTFDSCINY